MKVQAENWNAQLARRWSEGLQSALRALGTGSRLDDAQVHDARKELKRLRSLLRLARAQLTEAVFQSENRALRDCARALAPARDAVVLPQALSRLLPERRPRAHRVQRVLRHRAIALTSLYALSVAALRKLRQTLRATQRRAARWEWRAEGWAPVRENLQASYRRGRRALRRAHARHDDQSLHEWRKQAKHLYHQLKFLEALWPEPLHAQAKQVRRLQEILGDDHDLALLARALPEFTLLADIDSLQKKLRTRRRALQGEAFALGQKIYAEGPHRFAHRLTDYWESESPAKASAPL